MVELKESWTTSYEEKILEPKIEYFLVYLSSDSLCITECDDQSLEEPHDLKDKNIQGNKYYIEVWFQTIIRPQNPSILQHFLESSPQEKLASYVQATIEVYFSNLDTSLLVNMLCTWIH
jgi:hypothetical protein